MHTRTASTLLNFSIRLAITAILFDLFIFFNGSIYYFLRLPIMQWEGEFGEGDEDEKELWKRREGVRASLALLEKDIYRLESLHLSIWDGGNLLVPSNP